MGVLVEGFSRVAEKLAQPETKLPQIGVLVAITGLQAIASTAGAYGALIGGVVGGGVGSLMLTNIFARLVWPLATWDYQQVQQSGVPMPSALRDNMSKSPVLGFFKLILERAVFQQVLQPALIALLLNVSLVPPVIAVSVSIVATAVLLTIVFSSKDPVEKAYIAGLSKEWKRFYYFISVSTSIIGGIASAHFGFLGWTAYIAACCSSDHLACEAAKRL